MATKLAIIYYSSTGTLHGMARRLAEAGEKAGAEVRLRQVAELAPPEAIAEEVARMRDDYASRASEYRDKLARRTSERAERSLTESEANTAQAADLRRRFR